MGDLQICEGTIDVQAYISKFNTFISENTDNLFFVLKVQVNEQITYLSFYCIFRKWPNFYGNGFVHYYAYTDKTMSFRAFKLLP